MKNIDSTGDQNSRHISNHWLRCNNKNEILEIKFPGGVIQLKLPLERTICAMSTVDIVVEIYTQMLTQTQTITNGI